MRHLTAATAIVATFCASADIRLPEYNQVAGVSNQVMALDAKLTSAALDAEAVKNLVLGSESASPFLAGIRVTFNTGEHAVVPPGEEYYKSLDGAYISVQAANHLYKFAVPSIRTGAQQQLFVPCDTFEDVRLKLHLGPADHYYAGGEQIVHLHNGELVEVAVDTYAPLNPSGEDVPRLRMFGRAQYYDPDGTYGKKTSGESFPIQRVFDPTANAWVTQFGFYSNSVWHTECDVYNEIPQLDETGAVVNLDEVGNCEHAYEALAFPWKDARRVAVRVDPSMLADAGQATPATNLYFFTRVPIYVYKETVETMVVTNLAANGTVSSATAYPMQIHWVADPAITNGYDASFYIPSWEKVYARDYDEATGTWSTRCIGVKEANYYACYKSAPTSAKNNNWRMAGNNNYTLQSYPWPHRDSSNYGVSGLTRATMNAYAHKLNPFAIAMSEVNGVEEGEVFATYAAASGDMEDRRWAGNTWHDYQAFRELAYIQFGANVQSTASEMAADGVPRVIGIVGNQTTSVLEAQQDDLEFFFGQQINLRTFTIAPRAANGYSFAWLGILNFWGSEGDQMADVTTVMQTDADGTKSIWYLACLDRSRFIPDTTGGAASYALFTDSYGYEKLTYYWAYTGLAGTYYRGKDAKADYAAFNLVATTPASSADPWAVNLNSSAYDGVYASSTYPAVPASGSQFSYWMCSLSHNRSNALGPWYVYSNSGPSSANANYWGGRASLNILEAEREARSGE